MRTGYSIIYPLHVVFILVLAAVVTVSYSTYCRTLVQYKWAYMYVLCPLGLKQLNFDF